VSLGIRGSGLSAIVFSQVLEATFRNHQMQIVPHQDIAALFDTSNLSVFDLEARYMSGPRVYGHITFNTHGLANNGPSAKLTPF